MNKFTKMSNEKSTSGESREAPIMSGFRSIPQDLLDRPPLVSSLQNLEQSFELVGLRRFPGALVSCAVAWECALKAWLRTPQKNDIGLEALLPDARSKSEALRRFSEKKLADFRWARNRIMHHGYSPKDDDQCATLLLETGWPFLKVCYRELFGFHLDWRDIRPDIQDFTQLTPEEMGRAGLITSLAEQLRVVSDTFAKARPITGMRPSLCFLAFEHFIRWGWKENSMTSAEAQILERATEVGVKFYAEKEQKERVRKSYKDEGWEFDCPVCHEHASVVGELDMGGLDCKVVRLRSCVCVACHLVIPRDAVYLADVLLAKQLESETPKILKEFGIG